MSTADSARLWTYADISTVASDVKDCVENVFDKLKKVMYEQISGLNEDVELSREVLSRLYLMVADFCLDIAREKIAEKTEMKITVLHSLKGKGITDLLQR